MFLDAHEFRVQITDSSKLPTVYVQLRAAYLHEVGAEEAIDASLSVAEAIVGRPIDEASTSRVDLYADFADWVLRRDDLAGLVTNAKISTFARAGTDELETVMVGKSPLAVRLYRKDVEVRERGGFAPLFWGGHQGPVLRVEVQAAAAKLRELQITSVAECLDCHGDVWTWATRDFLDLRQRGPGPRESWPRRPEWGVIQQVGLTAFPRCGLVPHRVVQGSREKLIPALLGYLSSYAALEGLTDPAAVLGRLLMQFPRLTSSEHRTFAAEVARKRALLPKAVREAEVASARDRPPSPEGGDIEGSTVGSDA